MPPMNALQLLKRSEEEESQMPGLKPFRFARPIPVDISPQNSGKWQSYGNTDVWRIEIFSSGAYGQSVFFEKFRLTNKAILFIYDPSAEQILGGFNELNNKISGVFPTGFIPGERLIVELQVEKGASYGELQIASVSQAFRDIFGKKDGRFGLSGSCNTDINCQISEPWQTNKRAVCRILIMASNEFCTGTLMNNTRNDSKPIILTAAHCIGNSTESESSVFYFGYESPECNGVDGKVNRSISSARLLSSNDSIDFAMLELSDSIPWAYNPFYAGWNLNTSRPPSAVTIHHPEGDVKKISWENDPLLITYPVSGAPSWLYPQIFPSAFWRVARWDIGTTEGGSSGAPLFDNEGFVIGNLTGGDANCTQPVNDYFSKLWFGWDYYSDSVRQIKHWLDPMESQIPFLKGFDPFNPDPEEGEIELFSLFPNPNTGQFTIETDTLDLMDCRIKIYTPEGKIVGDYLPESTRFARFDLSAFSAGLYIIELNFGELLARKKFIIVK